MAKTSNPSGQRAIQGDFECFALRFTKREDQVEIPEQIRIGPIRPLRGLLAQIMGFVMAYAVFHDDRPAAEPFAYAGATDTLLKLALFRHEGLSAKTQALLFQPGRRVPNDEVDGIQDPLAEAGLSSLHHWNIRAWRGFLRLNSVITGSTPLTTTNDEVHFGALHRCFEQALSWASENSYPAPDNIDELLKLTGTLKRVRHLIAVQQLNVDAVISR